MLLREHNSKQLVLLIKKCSIFCHIGFHMNTTYIEILKANSVIYVYTVHLTPGVVFSVYDASCHLSAHGLPKCSDELLKNWSSLRALQCPLQLWSLLVYLINTLTKHVPGMFIKIYFRTKCWSGKWLDGCSWCRMTLSCWNSCSMGCLCKKGTNTFIQADFHQEKWYQTWCSLGETASTVACQ